jgi:xanthine dehydrogenase iron-sulfur cluster and FAD-binding subunit A
MDEVGAQCGICTPGMILSALALGEKPSLAQVKTGLAGNLCRCTGYEAIYRAIAKANTGTQRGPRLAALTGVKNERAAAKRRPARPSGNTRTSA